MARPARLAAMIDWELSTIGDPMIDLGWFTGGMRDEDFPDKRSRPRSTTRTISRPAGAGALLLRRAPGRDISEFDYFSILARFKSGCLLEYKVAQAEAGILPRRPGGSSRGSSATCSKRPGGSFRR